MGQLTDLNTPSISSIDDKTDDLNTSSISSIDDKIKLLQQKYIELSQINEMSRSVQSQKESMLENNEHISFLGIAHINANKKLYTTLIALGNLGLITAIFFLLRKNNNGNI